MLITLRFVGFVDESSFVMVSLAYVFLIFQVMHCCSVSLEEFCSVEDLEILIVLAPDVTVRMKQERFTTPIEYLTAHCIRHECSRAVEVTNRYNEGARNQSNYDCIF